VPRRAKRNGVKNLRGSEAIPKVSEPNPYKLEKNQFIKK